MKKLIAISLSLLLMLGCSACSQIVEQDAPAVPDAGNSSAGDSAADAQTAAKFDMPDLCSYEASLLDGGKASAQELYQGADVIVINCWATWCPPCLGEMDELAAFEKTLPDNVRLMTMCLDGTEEKDECARILQEAGFEGTTLIEADGDFSALLSQMQYVPTTVFLDSEGHLVCDSLIGAPSDLPSAYKEKINAGLSAAGKDLL